jgi:hypothetical protein
MSASLNGKSVIVTGGSKGGCGARGGGVEQGWHDGRCVKDHAHS